jgi:hypothetical protein
MESQYLRLYTVLSSTQVPAAVFADFAIGSSISEKADRYGRAKDASRPLLHHACRTECVQQHPLTLRRLQSGVPTERQTALKNNIFIAASDVLGNNAPAVISPQRN